MSEMSGQNRPPSPDVGQILERIDLLELNLGGRIDRLESTFVDSARAHAADPVRPRVAAAPDMQLRRRRGRPPLFRFGTCRRHPTHPHTQR